MDRERWRRIDELFQRALELEEPEARRALLAAETDAEIRSQVAGMLEAEAEEEAADLALGGIVRAGLAWAEGGEEGPPERLGSYRLIREIGRGGLATVYLAERDDDQFSRQVAIKWIRRGLDTEEILERLRLERQILANLDHPYIARMFDGGTSEDGRPYFVMEAIFGERIDLWCNQQGLGLNQRLELFRKVCEATDFAHRNLVLHRDIKPSNLLVTEDGTPKLLDFGIAKVLAAGEPGMGMQDGAGTGLGAGLATPTLTRPGARLLTPEFASPEQVRAEALTTASDVYSLGVLLYLLITGRRPYAIERGELGELARHLETVRPLRPSQTVALARKEGDTVPTGWPRASRAEDLDNIVLMALRQEPERRYASAGQLSEDLRRYLGDLPVAARKDSLTYRSRKFVRRHRLAVAAASVTLLTLLAAVVLTSWQAAVARVERTRAEGQRARAEEVASFLTSLFANSDPYHSLGEEVSARQVLDEGARRILHELPGSPQVRADLLNTMGKAYQNLSLFEDSGRLLSEAVELRRASAVEPADLAASLLSLADLRVEEQRFVDAEALLKKALTLVEGSPREQSARKAEILFWLARAKTGNADFVQAEQLFEEALAVLPTEGEEELQADLLYFHADHWLLRQQPARAVKSLQQALELRRAVHGEVHPKVANTLETLAVAKRQSGDFAAAIKGYEQVLTMNRMIFGPRHGHVALTLYNLAVAQESAGDSAVALDSLGQSLEITREIHGEEHPAMARIYHQIARVHRLRAEYVEATQLARRALEIDLSFRAADHPSNIRHRLLLANLATTMGDPGAEELHLQVLQAWRRTLPPEDPRIASSLYALGGIRLKTGDLKGAEELLRQALGIWREAFGSEDWRVAQAQGELGRCLALAGQPEEGAEFLHQAHGSLRTALGAEHVRTLRVEGYLEELGQLPGG